MAAIFFTNSVLAKRDSSLAACQETLDAGAARYRLKADRADAKHTAELVEMLEKARSKATTPVDESNSLDKVVARLVDRRSPKEARFAFVENVVELVTKIDVDKDGNFACLDNKTLKLTFDANLQRYEDVLELIQAEVKERLDIVSLDKDEGLVVIAFNSNASIDFVSIEKQGSFTGNILLGPLRPGEYFRVIKAKSGRYTWREIRIDVDDRYVRWYTYDLDQFEYSFEIEAGKLNYTGVLLYEILPGNYFSGDLHDRLTIVLTALEQRYPELLEQYEFSNGLFPEDRFTQFYLQEKRIRQSSDVGAR